MGYVGKRIPGIDRITATDPAGIGFDFPLSWYDQENRSATKATKNKIKKFQKISKKIPKKFPKLLKKEMLTNSCRPVDQGTDFNKTQLTKNDASFVHVIHTGKIL